MGLFAHINFKEVDWLPTLQLHVVRAVCAGLVWMLVALCAGAGLKALTAPLMFPFFYVIGLPIYLGVAKLVGAIMGDQGFGQLVMGLIVLAASLGIVVGDPLVMILHRQVPRLVPVEEFKFMNFVMVLFVCRPSVGAVTSA